ncbi:MAG: 2-oxoglutarate dehydrogenase, E2 component, dihydrolipoamide succinyltransferase, partial [Elusimicrobiota bacterium]
MRLAWRLAVVAALAAAPSRAALVEIAPAAPAGSAPAASFAAGAALVSASLAVSPLSASPGVLTGPIPLLSPPAASAAPLPAAA